MSNKEKSEKLLEEYRKKLQKKLADNDVLLQNIKASIEELEELRQRVSRRGEDLVYRYYHASFKVYWVQDLTKEIVDALKKLSPHEDKELRDDLFQKILDRGCQGVEWELEHNQKWDEVCSPFIEAFFHAKYFLEMAIKYGKELEKAPTCLPSGWAALLYLYDLR